MGVIFIADVHDDVMQHELVSSTMPVMIPQRQVAPEPIAPAEDETILAPSKGWIAVNWRELIRGRELLYFMVWRDVKVRYKQAVLGAAWVVLQPLFNMILFTVLFGRVANFSSKMGPIWGSRYSLYVFVAMVPWQIVASGLSNGGMSLVNQTHLLTKIYFPRLFVPTSVVGGALFDFAISSIFVIVLMVWYHVAPGIWIIGLPLLLLLTMVCSAGAAYLFSALTITYRDFRFLIPFIGQVWMWGSFVAFPPFTVNGPLGFKSRIILSLNPMYAIIAAWRKMLLGGAPDSVTGFDPLMFATSVVIVSALFLLGIFYFRRTERRFADIA